MVKVNMDQEKIVFIRLLFLEGVNPLQAVYNEIGLSL